MPTYQRLKNHLQFSELFLCLSLILFSVTSATAGPEVDRIGTFNGTTLWLGYNFGFSENYIPESETYNWMLYIAPEGLYVGLTSVRSVYSAVDVNAGGGLFYGSWAVPQAKLTVAGSGQPTGYPYITWNNMGSISGITITKEPFPTSLPVAGPLSGLGVGISMGPTFFREGSSNSLQAALQLNTIMSVSFALVPMPSFIPSVSLDLSGPGDTNLTGDDTGFYPVVLWDSPITLAEINAKGTIQAVIDKLNSSASSQGLATLNGQTQTLLASSFSAILSGASGNGQKISNFIDSHVNPGGSASGAEVEQLISGAENWLQTGSQEQAAEKLRELMDQDTFDFPALYNEMNTLESGVGLGFQVAYRNGYQWAVDNNTRDDDIFYTDEVETVYCAIGSNCSIVVTTEEIYGTLGLTYPEDSADDIFESEELHFSASMEKMLASVDNIGTEEVIGILDRNAEHTLSQNSGISQLCNISMFLDLTKPKFQGLQYKKVNLKTRKIYFLSSLQDVHPADSVTIAVDPEVVFPVDQQIQWTQRFGPQVQLSGANTKTPSFTAPQIGAEANLLVFDVSVGTKTYPNAGVINIVQPKFAVQDAVEFDISEYLTGVVSIGTDLLVVDINNQNFRKINSSGQQTGTIDPSPAITGGYPFDATYYNNKVYYTIYLGDAVYAMNTDGTGNTKAFTTSFNQITGICHDGTNFWVGDQSTAKARIYKLTNSGATVSSFISPVPNPSGMTFDGTNLWVVDNVEQKLCRISTVGTVQECYKSPGTQPMGIDFDPTGNLWNVDLDQSKLYKLALYPTADTGSDKTANEGETVNLDGSASSAADGGALSYQWIQEQGPQVVLVDSDTSLSSFIAPNVDSAATLSFKLVVTDANNFSSGKTCKVIVNDTGLIVKSVPGNPQIAIESSMPTLDGSSSIGAVKYTWKQHRGPNAQILSPAAAKTKIIMPAVTQATSLVFELIVENSTGLESSELIDVTVLPANLSGVIQLLQMLSGQSVELAANYDFNGDGKTGLQDVVHLMHSL